MPTNGYRNTNLAGCCPDVQERTITIDFDHENPPVGPIVFPFLGALQSSLGVPGIVLPLLAELIADPNLPPMGTAIVGSVVVTDNGPGVMATIEIPIEFAGLAAGDFWFIRLLNGEGCGCVIGTLQFIEPCEAPTVELLDPNTAEEDVAPITVTVTGTGFTEQTTAQLVLADPPGVINPTVTFVSDTEIELEFAPTTGGTYTLILSNGLGCEVVVPDAFTITGND